MRSDYGHSVFFGCGIDNCFGYWWETFVLLVEEYTHTCFLNPILPDVISDNHSFHKIYDQQSQLTFTSVISDRVKVRMIILHGR